MLSASLNKTFPSFCIYLSVYVCMYVCILYIWIYLECMSGFDLIHTYSFQPVLHNWCNKSRGMYYPVCAMILFAVTEVRAWDTESPAIVGKARYAFAQLANHTYIHTTYIYSYNHTYIHTYIHTTYIHSYNHTYIHTYIHTFIQHILI